MKIYCFWLCKRIGVPFMVDSAEVVAKCPFCDLTPEDEGSHFESGHLRRVCAEDLIIMENEWIKNKLGLRIH